MRERGRLVGRCRSTFEKNQTYAVVHHLVEQLVAQDEVLPEGLLGQRPAVVLEDPRHRREEL